METMQMMLGRGLKWDVNVKMTAASEVSIQIVFIGMYNSCRSHNLLIINYLIKIVTTGLYSERGLVVGWVVGTWVTCFVICC